MVNVFVCNYADIRRAKAISEGQSLKWEVPDLGTFDASMRTVIGGSWRCRTRVDPPCDHSLFPRLLCDRADHSSGHHDASQQASFDDSPTILLRPWYCLLSLR